MTAFQYRLPAGIPGTISRAWPTTVEGQQVDASNPPTVYGAPVVIDATTEGVRPVAAADTAIYGFLVRSYPTQGPGTGGPLNLDSPYGPGIPPNYGVVSVLRQGYMSTALSGSASAVKGGQVYVWTAASAAPHVQGGLEAAATTGSTILVPGATFMSAADSSGNVEISFNV